MIRVRMIMVRESAMEPRARVTGADIVGGVS